MTLRPEDRVEWIETNGLGGYAFGTSSGRPTRRYHGLLISARKPPVDRRMLVADLQIFPAGVLARRVFMRHGHNVTVVRYQLKRAASGMKLDVRPLLAMRDHNEISRSAAARPITHKMISERQILFSGEEDECFIYFSHGKFIPNPRMVGPFRYDWETHQGMDDTEYLHSPGSIVVDLAARSGGRFDIILSDKKISRPDPAAWEREEAIRRKKFTWKRRAGMKAKSAETLSILSKAADQFIVMRQPGNKKTIVAGYPWFTDWGRDTMISLEGLTLVRGEFKAAREILAAFAGAESQGMIPNHYPDAGTDPHYNTVDASLWFFEAGWKYGVYSGDWAFVRKTLFPVYRSIVRHHLSGTRFNIHADKATGFLFSGEEGTQLTWMDAKVDDWVVTPRHGYPVEIQALWHNALRIFILLAEKFRMTDDLSAECARIADRCQTNFPEKYWNEKRKCLYDCLTPGWMPVQDIRPNQLIALSLTHPIVTEKSAGRKILAAVRKLLLTPMGLRTLAPSDPNYRGRHAGSRLERDAAYHQGTVWPWLIGPYARAMVYVEGATRATATRLEKILAKFRPHLATCAAGTVSEIFDGDPPHEPKACVAQAWSVAELLAIGHYLSVRI